ncbi:MAG: hypothetical protein PF568_04875 [Deltaproteobacteria bacterium]|jgi:hypothetical protein|nr:hypothetical protein [Deltaproteobacteria bacterium]
MWIHLLIFGITLGFSAAYNIDLAGWYEISAQSMAGAQGEILVQALIGASLLILLALVMAQMNAYSLMLPLAKLLLEISLFGVSFLSFGSLYFSLVLSENVWFDLGLVAMVPFVGVVTAISALQLFDFNYPYQHKFFGCLILSALSFTLVLLFVRFL